MFTKNHPTNLGIHQRTVRNSGNKAGQKPKGDPQREAQLQRLGSMYDQLDADFQRIAAAGIVLIGAGHKFASTQALLAAACEAIGEPVISVNV
jgi:hypothetical protein